MLYLKIKLNLFLLSILCLLSTCTNLSVRTPGHIPTLESPDQIEKCEEVARKILSTSPRYIALTKVISENAQISGSRYFGLETESSPFTENNDDINAFRGAYYFTLYEMHLDRQLNVARFVFIYKREMLFEIDMATNKWEELEYDRKLLLEYNCSR